MSPLPGGAKQFDRGLNYLDGDPSGVGSIPCTKSSKRGMCDGYDDEAKKIYEKIFESWSPVDTISADQLVSYVAAVKASNPNLRYDAGLMITESANGLPFE
ncbi:hypothetical protein [Lysobacter enzymogenes]|uniref:hypothetical protein n=1 Tax=Lysobacter enzymogenes TaxID=69 RepID=UPI0011138421|nr:hypothetical protein [Lysobacter enzymogenes]